MSPRVWGALALLLTLGVLAPGCAPRPAGPPDLDATSRRARYLRSLAQRETAGRAAEVELSVWVRSSSLSDIPGVQARLLLERPDAFRVRIESAFGTAIDLATRGDSLAAYVPSRRLGLTLGGAGDSLGVREPGALGCRLWGATWRPPPEAWQNPSWRDSGMVVHWTEAGDSLALTVGSNGLPSSLRYTSARGDPLTVRYAGWSAVERVPWPTVLYVAKDDGSLSVACRVQRVRFIPTVSPERFAIRFPERTDRLTLARLRRALERVGRP